MRRNRSRSLSHQEKRNRSKKKKHRHRSSSDSSSSSSSEDRSRKHKRKQKHRRSRSKSRQYDRRPKVYRRHRSFSSYSSFSSEERVFKRPRTDYQRHEHPNDVIRSSSPIRVQSDNQQRSSYCAREINSPAMSNTEHDISINVRPQDNDFENLSEHRDSVQDPGGDDFEPTEDEERASFYQLIEEVFKFLPADRFPRKSEVVESNQRPRSSIELDVTKTQRKSISLPQSPVVSDSVTYIQNSLENTVIGENWIPAAKDIAKLVTMKFYQAHNEKFSTSSASRLDDAANRLGLSLSGNCNLPAKYLEIFEKQCRDNIRLLSHADVFSFAAFKCLQQEKMDSKILSRILESLSSSIKDAIGLSAFTAIGLQQVRREAAIRAAPRSLTDQAKKRLRKIPFASHSLFRGKVDEIYKENTETNRGTLVHKAISNQAKSQNSSSQIHKPKSDQKKTTGPKSQPLSNREGKQFSQTPRSARGGHFQGGSGSRGRAPSRRGASSSRKFWGSHSTAPPPSSHSGRREVGPLCPKLAKGHKQQVGPLFSQDRLQDTIHRTTAPVSGPNLFQQSLSPQLEEEVASLLQKGAVKEIHPVSPGFYSRIFLVPKKNGKVRLIIDLSTLNRHVFIQSFKMETQRKVRNAIRLNDWAFSLDLTDAYLHVQIHPRSRKYLRFTLNGRVYHFKALPFGLSTSPFVFTLLMTVIATHLRKRAIIMHPYLDHWLSRNRIVKLCWNTDITLCIW